jgi:uncharacterized damage-inducible protein DinB
MPTPLTQGAWRANLKVNGVLLEHLTPEMLDARTPGGGYSVAQHLAHMTQTVNYWGWLRGDDFDDLPELYYDYNPETHAFKAVTDLDRVREVMAQTYARALEVPDTPETSDKSEEPPHPTADTYLMHMMVHDAHHRGQILLALKTAGHPLPDEDALWGPWRGADQDAV